MAKPPPEPIELLISREWRNRRLHGGIEDLSRGRRRQHSIPAAGVVALRKLLHDHPGFEDDGCTNSLDSMLGYDFRWACRLHDAAYCTRVQRPQGMSHWAKGMADRQLGRNIRASLPPVARVFAGALYSAATLLLGGGSYNTCWYPIDATDYQREHGLCRHSVGAPEWMERIFDASHASSDTARG